MIRKTFIAATLAMTTLAAPAAMAGGTLSFEVNPTNAEEANMIRLGLGIFQIANGGDPAQVLQNGNGNGAGLGQSGGGNQGVIYQEGNGNSGTLSQNGCDSYGIFQFGNGANANVAQGDGCQTGLLFQVGLD
jgi:minor curlin subunit|tara:strand:+ start:88 stop:483 length:396 start_codon:yes stop_codon:yes gene_type:complete